VPHLEPLDVFAQLGAPMVLGAKACVQLLHGPHALLLLLLRVGFCPPIHTSVASVHPRQTPGPPPRVHHTPSHPSPSTVRRLHLRTVCVVHRALVRHTRQERAYAPTHPREQCEK
jgi:hypothetical protein